MRWNLNGIRFLYPPDDFDGVFDNDKMQSRHVAMRDEKIAALKGQLHQASSPLAAMHVLNPLDHLLFLQNNAAAFHGAGQFEQAVLRLFYRKNTPFASDGAPSTWQTLLLDCDRDLLAACGRQFVNPRGVGFRGSILDNSFGFNWTVSKEKAQWFLARWRDKELGGGTVFQIEFARQDVLVYLSDEHRDEVILHPDFVAGAPRPMVAAL